MYQYSFKQVKSTSIPYIANALSNYHTTVMHSALAASVTSAW